MIETVERDAFLRTLQGHFGGDRPIIMLDLFVPQFNWEKMREDPAYGFQQIAGGVAVAADALWMRNSWRSYWGLIEGTEEGVSSGLAEMARTLTDVSDLWRLAFAPLEGRVSDIWRPINLLEWIPQKAAERWSSSAIFRVEVSTEMAMPWRSPK